MSAIRMFCFVDPANVGRVLDDGAAALAREFSGRLVVDCVTKTTLKPWQLRISQAVAGLDLKMDGVCLAADIELPPDDADFYTPKTDFALVPIPLEFITRISVHEKAVQA